MVWWLRRLRAAGLFHPLAEKFFEIKKRLVDIFRGLRRGGQKSSLPICCEQ